VTSWIYFFDHFSDERFVYVGYDGSRRLTQHRAQGATLLAVMPGSRDFEGRIHEHFQELGALAPMPSQNSIYQGEAIWEYVAWLSGRGYAVPSEDDAEHLPVLPWFVIAPQKVDPHFDDEAGQRALFKPSRRARIAAAARAAYHLSQSDEWYTPVAIVESARAVLGAIDLDPASCPRANTLIRASAFYSKQVDGLTHPWRGRIWMNPPYNRLAQQFAQKLVTNFQEGLVTEAVALFNANSMTSQWFSPLYDHASALMITRGRLLFTPGDPDQNFSSPSTGSVVLYFGPQAERFAEEFCKHGTILTVIR